MHLSNAGEASYPDGWKDYRAVASYDQDEWFRVPTTFDGHVLTIEHTPELDSVYYAYFAPYPSERHRRLVASAAAQPGVGYRRLGATVDDRDLDLLQVGPTEPGRAKIWIIARQHPGETMAEWLLEGLIQHLLDPDEPVSRALRRSCTFYIVPNMNPDGSARGHLRNNAAGVNLNRAWTDPSLETSPEVYHVRSLAEELGADFFLDVHGDEVLPYNFISGAEGVSSWTESTEARQRKYLDALASINPDFQTEHGYPISSPGKANMTMATNWMAERFECLSMTLEQPFKDTKDTPHENGWCPERAKKLGRDQLLALFMVRNHLR